ncbi:MAG: hypothetical protein NTZ05_03085 [Chloroflexi bacterium]|nr:hypothetical protein [Chloroflexota bacterium]
MVLLALSVLLSFSGVGMLAASVAMRQRTVADGVQPGDAYLYAAAGGVVTVVAWLFAMMGAASSLIPPMAG